MTVGCLLDRKLKNIRLYSHFCLDLGAWGAVYTEGWDQQLKLVRDEAKTLKTAIIHDLIYPPAANRDAAFAAADPLAKFV